MKTKAIRKILVPVDFSSCSRAAFEFARGLGTSLGASLEVLFVRPPSDGNADEAAAAAAKEELRQFIASAGGESASISERVEAGDARERIVALAEQGGFDLVVLGTHGRTGRPRSLAGSVAESVVRTSPRPVLTVRD